MAPIVTPISVCIASLLIFVLCILYTRYDRDPMAQFEKNSMNNGTHTKKNKIDQQSTTDGTPIITTTVTKAEVEPVGGTRVTVIGDAAHPMSMFKGQGANQALADGPLLTQWLLYGASKGQGAVGKTKQKREYVKDMDTDAATALSLPAEALLTGPVTVDSNCSAPDLSFLSNQATVFTRLRCFEREMCDRSTPKVLASRQAAAHLHSSAVMNDIFGIAGVKITNEEQNTEVLTALREAGVSAALGSSLDQAVKDALEKYIE